jgi:hypothetical protein
MKAEERMENWEVMQQAIPRGTVGQIAAAMRKRGYRCSHDLVTRWTRPQTSDETPEATGQASPVDKVKDLVEVITLENGRDCAALIPNQIVAQFHRIAFPDPQILTLVNSDSLEAPNQFAAQLLNACGRAVASMTARGGISRDTAYQLIQLKQLAEEAVLCVNQDLIRKEMGARA